MAITTREVLAVLSELARLTTLDEGSPQSFKVRAYENALHGIEGVSADLGVMTVAELVTIKGVGRSIAEKISELIETGSVGKLEELRAKYPPGFVELAKIPGLGPKTLKRIRAELGVENLDDLRRAVAAHQLRDLPGLGRTSEEKIARAIDRLGLHGKDRRTPIAEARPLAEQLAAELSLIEGVVAVEICGSIRRHAETIGDIDITVAATDSPPVMAWVAGHPRVNEVVLTGETKTSILTREGLQIDVRVVAPDQMGAALVYFTGSKAHNISLRQRAIERGWLLNEYGLFEEDRRLPGETEDEIYRALGLAPIPPPLRENTGEVEAAATGKLPDLVMLGDIRGDLHYHTDRSGDGRSSPAEMVAAAAARGYEYLAITDHGENLTINGLSKEEMRAHREVIRTLQENYPDLTLLFGCELNIGRDGSLDYDPDFRLELDWCVASVHSHFDLSAAQQTERVLAAIADPSVNVIGHLTGRYIGRRPGIDLELAAVLEALAETGVGLEVNGALQRLDASAEVIRRAVAAGVSLVISTDSHHTSDLRRMTYGVLNAQRGWADRRAVANTWPKQEFLAWASARRS